MIKNKLEVINFLQDFGCARLEHLQTLFNAKDDNFKSILTSNVVTKKDNIFVYNNKTINNNMLVALDILCKYKGRYISYYPKIFPVTITFLTKDNTLYHIMVADELNQHALVKRVNDPKTITDADKYILAFPDETQLYNINTTHSFLYCIYPSLETLKQV